MASTSLTKNGAIHSRPDIKLQAPQSASSRKSSRQHSGPQTRGLDTSSRKTSLIQGLSIPERDSFELRHEMSSRYQANSRPRAKLPDNTCPRSKSPDSGKRPSPSHTAKHSYGGLWFPLPSSAPSQTSSGNGEPIGGLQSKNLNSLLPATKSYGLKTLATGSNAMVE